MSSARTAQLAQVDALLRQLERSPLCPDETLLASLINMLDSLASE